MTPITSIVVGIPARNEHQRIAASVTSVLQAIKAVENSVRALVTVACDSCQDGTAALLARMQADHPLLHVVSGDWGSAGGARHAAIAHGLAIAADTPIEAIWIATTDADTIVPPDWLQLHLRHAAEGADAVAGVVDLLCDEDLTADTLTAFDTLYEMHHPTTHPHVHGANLGVRAAAFLRAGGFPELAVAEDHALWDRLRALAYRCVSPRDVRVCTSARLRSRAPGGFATTLAAAL